MERLPVDLCVCMACRTFCHILKNNRFGIEREIEREKYSGVCVCVCVYARAHMFFQNYSNCLSGMLTLIQPVQLVLRENHAKNTQ